MQCFFCTPREVGVGTSLGEEERDSFRGLRRCSADAVGIDKAGNIVNRVAARERTDANLPSGAKILTLLTSLRLSS